MSSVKSFRGFLTQNSGIYAFRDIVGGKIYIGSAKNLWRRFLTYKNAFFFGTTLRINKILMNAAKKRGWENIRFYVLEIFNGSDSQLRDLEKAYFDKYQPFEKNGFNIRTETREYKKPEMSESGKKRIKEANTGENSSSAILNNNQVLEIKSKLCLGAKLKELSVKYGVSTTVISNIKRGKSWGHLKLSEEAEEILRSKSQNDKRKNFPEELVKSVKAELLRGAKIVDVAKKYGLKYTAVSGLKYGCYYKHITP